MEFSVLGVRVNSVSMERLLTEYDEGLLVFHNLDTIRKASLDAEFGAVCRDVDLAVIDGQILRMLVSALWWRRAEKVSGSDFLPEFCRVSGGDDDVRVFLLGAGPGVADRARSTLNARAGREIVVGAHSPSFNLLQDDDESVRIIEMIRASGADTLAVGLGAPKQEVWLARWRDQMPEVRRLIAVGATLDFEAGRVRRSPRWMSRLGLEWFFRLCLEPRRLWRRYLVEGPQVIGAIASRRAREVLLS